METVAAAICPPHPLSAPVPVAVGNGIRGGVTLGLPEVLPVADSDAVKLGAVVHVHVAVVMYGVVNMPNPLRCLPCDAVEPCKPDPYW